MFFVQIFSQLVDAFWLRVPSHEANASDVFAIFSHEIIQYRWGEGRTYIIPEEMAVAARAMAGAIGYVDGQRYFIGYFLEHHTRIDIFQHDGGRGIID